MAKNCYRCKHNLSRPEANIWGCGADWSNWINVPLVYNGWDVNPVIIFIRLDAECPIWVLDLERDTDEYEAKYRAAYQDSLLSKIEWVII